MPRILIVEDQSALREALARGLAEEGYETALASDADGGETRLAEQPVDAVVLDLALPGRGGLEWLRVLRAGGFQQPVLIVTARDAVEERITGLDAGADDYLVKPIAFEELLARLRAVLRRTSGVRPTLLRVEDLELDLLRRRAARGGVELELTQRQFELLAYLMQQSGVPVRRETIARDVWKEGTATWTNVIEVQINQLRKRIERPGWPPLLHTIRGEGYVLGGRP